ncbi:MAG TPA: hypothetical protein P5110_06955 [Candidatus Omnitrophota bacterium]|nr:hypothetical protein [Candidatus Omnitrophota bacterium]
MNKDNKSTPVDTQPENPIVPEPQEAPVMTMLSQDDAYISDRIKSQPRSLDEVFAVKERRYEPGEHQLSLPKEFKPYQTKFAFRWIYKRKRAIDQAINRGWVIVNRVLFPELAREKRFLFSTSGAVERGDAVLAIMGIHIAEGLRKRPGEKSRDLVKAHLEKGKQTLPKGKSGFYQPDTSKEDKE